MTAFAAVVTPAGVRLDDRDAMAMCRALRSLTGQTVARWDGDGCTLFASPLHPWDSATIAVAEPGIVVIGGVTLEERTHLAKMLSLDPSARTEQIVATAFARWGARAMQHLRGEFTFAAWNTRERTLACARDPLGIRLLYVGSNAGVTVASNAIEAVLAHSAIDRGYDATSLVRFLADGTFTNGASTPYQKVRLLPEGHTLTVTPGVSARLERYWRPPQRTAGPSARDAESITRGFRQVLGDALHDRVGDHPFAVLLSGGLDSTALTAIGRERGSRMRGVTFSYDLPSVAAEIGLARSVAERMEMDLDVVNALAVTPMEAERSGPLPAVPVDESLLANWRHGLARAANFSTQVVHGDDADALLAPIGGAPLLARQSAPSIALESLRVVIRERRLPYLGLRVRERLGLSPHSVEQGPPWLSAAASTLLARDEQEMFGQRVTPLEHDQDRSPIWDRLLRNFPRYAALANDPSVTRQRVLLTLPMMDSRVIAYVDALPPIPWRHRKHLMRVAFEHDLPAAVVRRPKTPVTGLDEIAVEMWRTARPDDTRAVPHELIAPWIDRECVHKVLAGGATRAVQAAWRVLMLNAWLSQGGATRCTQ